MYSIDTEITGYQKNNWGQKRPLIREFETVTEMDSDRFNRETIQLGYI